MYVIQNVIRRGINLTLVCKHIRLHIYQDSNLSLLRLISTKTADMANSPIVSTEWLHQSLQNKNLRILAAGFSADTGDDSYQEFYEKGHIPGALYYDLSKYVEPIPNIPVNVPSNEKFQSYMNELAIGPDTHVVTYDRTVSPRCMRLWWLLKLYGHEKVSVLDGGLRKWIKDGYTVTAEQVTPDPTSDFKTNWTPKLIRDYNRVKQIVETGAEQVLDARSETQYKEGHIPGSIDIPYTTLFNEDGTVKDKETLKALFVKSGVDPGKPVIVSCNRGMSACCLAFGATIAGYKDVANYYGSWGEWKVRAPEHLKVKS